MCFEEGMIYVTWVYLTINAGVADAASDELGELGAVIKNKYALMHGESI